jgi:hypothetical protein
MYLRNIKNLHMQLCSQFTDDAFQNLANSQIASKNKLVLLNINSCRQHTITGETLTRENFPKLIKLKINGCNYQTQNKVKENFGVTAMDPNVKPQAGGYTRKIKFGKKFTRRN